MPDNTENIRVQVLVGESGVEEFAIIAKDRSKIAGNNFWIQRLWTYLNNFEQWQHAEIKARIRDALDEESYENRSKEY